MTSLYSKLVAPSIFQVAEEKKSYEYITERHLQAIWLEQKYFYQFFSLDGKTVQVLSPGLWNSEAGPDFLKAHLIIDNIEVRGDVELHLAEEGWIQHGHHTDERYNNVVLHIALWNSTQKRKIIKQNQESVVQCVLEPFLTIPISKILKLIDLELYPYKKFVGAGRCAKTLFNQIKEVDILRLFQEASTWRLGEKWKSLSYRLEEPQDIILGGIARTLGYKHNADQFLELYIWLKNYQHYSFEELLALALGTSGFFEDRFFNFWKKSEKYQMFFSLWCGLRAEADHQFNLILHQIRPYNHPVRRLVYLAHLMSDPQAKTLPDHVLHFWSGHANKSPKDLLAELLNVTPLYPDPFWNHRYLFESTEQRKYLPLIGGDLRREILVNVYLPYLHGHLTEKGLTKELEALQQFFHTIPGGKTGKSRYLIHRFFGETPKGKLLIKADCEQGAYQMHKDFCRHYESSCIGCPFVDRYKSHKP